MPTPFSWVVSRWASTQRHPIRPPRSRLCMRCVSAPVARSTSLLQRPAPPARPWATSASGADLVAVLVMEAPFNICSGAVEFENPLLVHLTDSETHLSGDGSWTLIWVQISTEASESAVSPWWSVGRQDPWQCLRNGSQSSSLKLGISHTNRNISTTLY